jgi:diguanylate cyclase (GGDEF)-like protein/PAS domain S-box-containing protein
MLLTNVDLAQQQDWRLSLLAGLIGLLTTVTAFSLLSRGNEASRGGRNGWVLAAALTLSLGAWAAHIIVQLDFMAAWQVHHDLAQAVIAVILAGVIAAIGLGLMQTGLMHARQRRQRRREGVAGLSSEGLSRHGLAGQGVPRQSAAQPYQARHGDPRHRGSVPIGGAIMGAALAALHYAGFIALRLPAALDFNAAAVIASVALVVLCGIGAALLLRRRDDLLHRCLAAGILMVGLIGLQALTVATAGLHFAVATDPATAGFAPDSPGLILSPFRLALAVSIATMILLVAGLAAALTDQHLVAEHKREAARLRLSETRLRQLADATFEGIVLHRDGWVIDANAAICSMLGLSLKQIIGHNLLEMVADGCHAKVTAQLKAAKAAGHTAIGHAMTEEASAGHPPEAGEPIEISLRHVDGRLVPVECLARTLAGEDGDLRVVAVRDISERKAAEERIRHMANHDALTGLPNRNLFQDRLTQAVARSKRGTSTAAVLCLDLDRFKNVNDLSGHDVGDALLRQVAQRLTNSVRADDTVARLSGDEFAIIQVGVAHPDGPAILADRLVKNLAQPFEIDGHQVTISTSLGISLYPGDGEDDEELLRAADTALYRAKAAGRGTYRFFEAEMDVRLQERRWMERELRQALAQQQLDLYYQPLVDCKNVTLLGFEALARWEHAERGFISPADFIPLAEECGLILPLGSWVLRRACRDAMTWPEDTIVAVNLSPAQFRQNDIVREVLGVLDETGLPAHRLELEITEGVLIDDTERVLETLRTLKDVGVRLSLDDFGTGYSSLSYLQRFPFDKIKIDRSFVAELGNNSDSMAIVRAVIALGRSLHITVTAEGVETQQQLALLRAENCDQAQGFLIGTPQPRSEAASLLADPESMMAKLRAAE